MDGGDNRVSNLPTNASGKEKFFALVLELFCKFEMISSKKKKWWQKTYQYYVYGKSRACLHATS